MRSRERIALITDKDPSYGEIWHPWNILEEFNSPMWGDVAHKNTWLKIAIEFTGDAELYGYWMMKVIEKWPLSCEHNLTKPGDKRPWIGHAAVALAINCPEHIVRLAWSHLTQEQQIKANKKAEEAIIKWRSNNA